jgi:chromate reductase
MSESQRTYQVGYFVGSLSSTSINRILSRALIRLAPPDLQFTEIPIGNLPLYSPDHDTDYPPEATALKEAIAQGLGKVAHPGDDLRLSEV